MLLKSGIDSSWFEMKLLLGYLLKKEPKYISFTENLNEEQRNIFANTIQQRLQHCPVDKIIGEKGFYKYDFIVNEQVLSPRADSEILVEKAISILKKLPTATILELGVGSGCLILSILAELKTITGVGIDISQNALDIAQKNVQKLGISNDRIKFYKKSWFENDIAEYLTQDAPYDLIISNPPYIPTKEIADLDEEVKNYDPLIALEGGEDGLRDYYRILDIAPQLLKDGGYILFEAGNAAQLQSIGNLAEKFRFSNLGIIKDLSGNERCIILKK